MDRERGMDRECEGDRDRERNGKKNPLSIGSIISDDVLSCGWFRLFT